MPPTLSSSSSPSKPFRIARWARYALVAVPVGIGLGFGCGGGSSQFTASGTGGTSTGSSSPTTSTNGSGGNIFAGTTSTTTTSGGPGGGPGACQSITPTKGPNEWAVKNSEMSGTQNALAVATDLSNNVLVAGATGANTSVTLGGLPPVAASAHVTNAFVAKLGPDGTPTWSQGFDVTGAAGSNGVIGSTARAVLSDTSGNVWVGGDFNGTMTAGSSSITSAGSGHVFGDAFVAMLDATGATQQLFRYGDSAGSTPSNGGGAQEVQGLAIHSTATGDVIAVVGQFESQLDLTIYPNGTLLQTESSGDNQPVGFLVVQKVADESVVFSAQFGPGTGQGQHALGVAFDASGDVLVTGDTTVPVSFPSGPMLTPMGSQAAFVAKIKGDGSATLWANVYGNTSASGASITTDASGNVFVAGQHTGMIDFGGGPLAATSGSNAFVAKLDPNGKYIWAHTYGVAGEHEANGIAVDSMGHAIVTGEFTGTMNFGTSLITGNANFDNIFLAKLDTEGCQIWAQAFGTTGDHDSYGVAVDSTGSPVIAGHISSTQSMSTTTMFGANTLTVPAPTGATATENLFVAKFGP